MKKSAIKLNPFWIEVPISKGIKKQYKEQTGLIIETMIVSMINIVT